MSKKFSLPSLKPASAADAAAGPVVVGATAVPRPMVVGAETNAAETVVAESTDNLVEASAEELGDVVTGFAEAVPKTVPAATEKVATETQPPPSSVDVAKLESLARDQVETRALVVAVTARLETELVELCRFEALEAACVKVAKDLKDFTLAAVADDTSYRRRLDHIDALLSSHGLPTSAATTTKPRLRLRPTRTLTVPARCVADGVVLAYNPRPADDIELTVTQLGKPVFTGYLVEVPEGYVCDVFVGADAVSSLRGRGDGELVVKVSVRQGFRSIPGGSELCRLALRKVEAVELEVVQ